MDTTDFTNRIEIENEQEELNEAIRATEEDHDLDHASITKNGLTEEQRYNFRQQNIKAVYAIMYSLGLNGKTDMVREKLDLISRFFGNIGGISNMSDKEICVFSHMIDDLKTRGYKFTR